LQLTTWKGRRELLVDPPHYRQNVIVIGDRPRRVDADRATLGSAHCWRMDSSG
jgi:hypothetical protein